MDSILVQRGGHLGNRRVSGRKTRARLLAHWSRKMTLIGLMALGASAMPGEGGDTIADLPPNRSRLTQTNAGGRRSSLASYSRHRAPGNSTSVPHHHPGSRQGSEPMWKAPKEPKSMTKSMTWRELNKAWKGVMEEDKENKQRRADKAKGNWGIFKNWFRRTQAIPRWIKDHITFGQGTFVIEYTGLVLQKQLIRTTLAQIEADRHRCEEQNWPIIKLHEGDDWKKIILIDDVFFVSKGVFTMPTVRRNEVIAELDRLQISYDIEENMFPVDTHPIPTKDHICRLVVTAAVEQAKRFYEKQQLQLIFKGSRGKEEERGAITMALEMFGVREKVEDVWKAFKVEDGELKIFQSDSEATSDTDILQSPTGTLRSVSSFGSPGSDSISGDWEFRLELIGL